MSQGTNSLPSAPGALADYQCPGLVNMTPFVQRPGLRIAQEQALQNPLAWSPLPIAAISQGPDWGISSQAYTMGYTDLQQPRQSPEKGNSLVSHELPFCPSHTEMQQGHPLLPPWSACFRPGHEHQEKRRLPAMLLPCIPHTHRRTKDNLALFPSLQYC